MRLPTRRRSAAADRVETPGQRSERGAMLGAAYGNQNHAILAQVFDQPLATG